MAPCGQAARVRVSKCVQVFLILLKRVQVTRVYRLCRELKLLTYLSVVMASPRPAEETEEGAMGRPSFNKMKIYIIYFVIYYNMYYM